MTDTPVLRPPLSTNEAAVARHFARDRRTGEIVPDDVLTAAATSMTTARVVAEQIASMHDTLHRDPSRSGPQVALALRQAVPPLAERAGVALDAAAARLRRGITDIEAEMAPRPPSSPEALQLSGELRAALAKMPPTERVKVLGDAVAAGDEATVSAVLRAPALLTGLTPEVQAGLRERWNTTRHPQLADRAGRLGKALGAVEAGGKAMVGYVEAIVNVPGAAGFEAAANTASAALRAGQEMSE